MNFFSENEYNFSCLDENLNRNGVLREYWSSGEQHTSSSIGVGAVMLLLSVIGVTWNLTVIVTILKKHLYHNPSVLLLLNIAITDLLLCLLVMPFSVISGFAGEYIFGNSDYTRCQVCRSNVILTLLSMESIYTLLFLTIDRLIYLKRPLQYNSLITARKVTIFLFLTWVGSLVLSIPPLFDFGNIGYEIKSFGICSLIFKGSTSIAPNFIYLLCIILIQVSCIVAIITINTWTVYIIHKNIKLNIRRSHELGRENKDLTFKQQFIIFRIFTTINIFNVLSWTPLMAMIFVRIFLRKRPFPQALASVAFVSFMSQPVLHPILQVFLLGTVKNALKECCNFLKLRLKRKIHS